MRLIFEVIMYFFIYGFLGWVCESIYCSIGNNKVINRGFLSGPICPIYGFGALIIIFFLKRYEDNIIAVFIYGMIVTSVLEYITGFLLETLFHTKWWDYSKKKTNIKGRVCLKNSILFGIMSVVLINVIHKNIYNLVVYIPMLLLIFLVINNFTWFFIDLSFTVVAINKLNHKLNWLDDIVVELGKLNIYLDKFDDENIKKLLKSLKYKEGIKGDRSQEIMKKLSTIKSKSIGQRRIIKAFPNMKHKYNHDRLINFKQIIQEKRK